MLAWNNNGLKNDDDDDDDDDVKDGGDSDGTMPALNSKQVAGGYGD